MKLIETYIAKNVLGAIALVTLMLSGLQTFILSVNQLGDLGKAKYDLLTAFWFVLLQLPYHVYLFFPMASLLGCLVGLGLMANHRELVVIRAAGMSIWQVTAAVFKAAFVLILMVTVLGECVVPKLTRLANDKKIAAMSNGQTLRTAKGMWLRVQNDFITIGTVLSNTALDEVYQFRFDGQHHLQFARHIGAIRFKDNVWKASDVRETRFHQASTEIQAYPSMNWDVAIKPTLFRGGFSEPDEMTLHELQQYLHAQKTTNQTASGFRLDYWQRVIQPFTTLVMMMIAIPFIFGPLRSSTMGSKLLVGATVGFGFYILNRFFAPLSQVYQWPPVIAAIAPTGVFACIGLYLMQRRG